MSHPIQTKLAHTRASLLDLVASISDDQLDWRGAEGWSIREILTHILNGEEDNTQIISAIIEGKTDIIPTEFDLDTHNARRLAARGHLTRDDLLAALAAQRARTESLLNDLSEDQMQLTGRHPLAGQATVSEIFRFIVLHDPLHAREIKAILDLSGAE